MIDNTKPQPQPIDDDASNEMLLEVIRSYQTLNRWNQFKFMVFLRWQCFKFVTLPKLSPRLARWMKNINPKRLLFGAAAVALALYLAIGVQVDYSPAWVYLMASVGTLAGSALGRALV